MKLQALPFWTAKIAIYVGIELIILFFIVSEFKRIKPPADLPGCWEHSFGWQVLPSQREPPPHILA